MSIAEMQDYLARTSKEAAAYRQLAEMLCAATGYSDPFVAAGMLIDYSHAAAAVAALEADRAAPTVRPGELVASVGAR